MSRSAAGIRGKAGAWDGFWVVDVSKAAASSAGHLEAMLLPLIAQQASESITPTYFIHFSDGGASCTIKHMSQLGEKTRTFRLGVPLQETTKDNVSIRQLMEMPSASVLVNTIEWPGRGKIVDTKTLIPAGSTMSGSSSSSAAGSGRASSSESNRALSAVSTEDRVFQTIEFTHRGGKKTYSERIWTRGDEAAAATAQANSEERAKARAGAGGGGAGAGGDEE